MELVHARVIGEGPDLIILHGYFGMGDNWKTLANQFSSYFKVHLIDQRNHGRSFHSDDFDYELMTEDLLNYMDFNKIVTADIIGHSMGGKTAMNFAVNYEQRVKSLIVADIGPKNYPPHHELILKALNSVDFAEQSSRSEIEDVLKKQIHESGVRQFLMKNVYRVTKDELGFRCNVDALTQHNNEIGAPLEPFTEYLGPTLFLKGENSGYISTDDLPLIEAHFPNYELVEIPRAGHWLHAENPKDFLKACYLFWRINQIS
ncbi:alpha/beta fold hydrolase [Flavobacteriaceae bacterium]|nr:alpha/beta fold hydrolase [Flavobacteriaceae bacterium]